MIMFARSSTCQFLKEQFTEQEISIQSELGHVPVTSMAGLPMVQLPVIRPATVAGQFQVNIIKSEFLIMVAKQSLHCILVYFRILFLLSYFKG